MIQQGKKIDGRTLWLDPEVEDFCKIMHEGHPVLGWEGDPELALFRISGNRWEIARWENGRFDTVCRSKPHAKLDAGILIRLMEHDLHRKTALQLMKEVDEHNARITAGADEQLQSTATEAMLKTYWGVGKAIGESKPMISVPRKVG